MTKTTSLIWILIAYLLCIASGALWLYCFRDSPSVLLHTFIADLIATLVIFIFSRRFKNSSFYDAFWSVIPPVIMAYWWMVHGDTVNDERVALMGIVMLYWACRLTWNWIKHWPGMAHEDWRYAMLRNKNPSVAFWVDGFAIHGFPTVQVFLGLLPVYAVCVLSDSPLNVLDYIAFAVGIAAVTLELMADIQLHNFIKRRKDSDTLNTGLWGWSRHPNYFGEFMFWVSLSLFGIAALPEEWWWQIIGSLAMLGMFLGASIPMIEERSLARRPEYQAVIDSVSKFVPLPPKR